VVRGRGPRGWPGSCALLQALQFYKLLLSSLKLSHVWPALLESHSGFLILPGEGLHSCQYFILCVLALDNFPGLNAPHKASGSLCFRYASIFQSLLLILLSPGLGPLQESQTFTLPLLLA
jgi:hypothetical protein